jgi:acetyl-CoA carboxylase biotin carboxyl carrier protein
MRRLVQFPWRAPHRRRVLSLAPRLAYKRRRQRLPQTGGSHEDGMTKHPKDADVAFIEALAKLLRDNDLTEIEVDREYAEDDRLTVRVSRAGPAHVPVAAPAYLPPPPQPAGTAAPAPASPTAEPADISRHPGAVTSPMVGTVYLQAEPGVDPFVKIGDTVAEGQTLLIVEAMKTMNQIPSPRAGTVKRILVGDGDPVEYGAPLMIVE